VRADAPADLRAAFDHLHGVVLEVHGDHDAARQLLERARAEEPDPLQRATIDIAQCASLAGVARYADAKAVCTRGVADLERELGPDHPAVGFALMSAGNVALRLDDFAAARTAFERCTAILDGTIGKGSVAYALALDNLGLLAQRSGDLVTARRDYERAIAMLEPLGHAQLASVLGNLARVERSSGNFTAARAASTRAIAIATASDGATSPRVAAMTVDAAAIAFSAGDLDAADAAYKRALAIATELGPAGATATADALGGIAVVAEQRGDCRTAARFFARSVEAYAALYGPDDDTVARDLDNLGRCQLTLDDRHATQTLERALAMFDARPPPDPFNPALTRWDLARALWQHGDASARPRALTLARAARTMFAQTTDPATAGVLADIDRWLASHGKPAPEP
jgi:tetratricopeptide (TPR) repeat protein